jgi:LCP family protein required for cell wall assembly
MKLLTSTTALLVVLVCGLGWGATSWLEAAVQQIDALDPDSSAIQDAAAQQGDQNFLVIGSDTRAGAPPTEDVGDSADIPGARTDTVMIVHVPEDRSRVTVVSFPRDLEITRPACERWDAVSGAYTGQWLPPTPRVKLNSAYAAGGPRCVTRAVQELSGLAVNRFLGVDFQGFKGMVDAVAGVPICVERPIDDSILGLVVPRAGTSLLTGDQALNYVRARHVRGDPSSDYGRIQRQQRFLGALLRTVLSAGTLLDPSKLRGLIEAVSRSTFGENIGADQLLSLSQSLGSLDPRAVSFVTVPTTGVANDRGNEVLRAGDERALFTAIIDNQPLPGTGPAPAAPVAPPVAPAEVRLVDARSAPPEEGEDEDGGSGDGAASSLPATTVAYRLQQAGFGVSADDRTGEGSRTTIRYSPDQEAAANRLAAAVPSAVAEPGGPGPGSLTLTLGDDFDGNVRSASAASPTGPVSPTISAADASCQ